MDGFTILQKIRERPDASKDVPVIIVSNLGQQADKDRAMSLGANDYIVKAEVEIEEIVKRLEKLIGPAEAPAAVPSAAPVTGIPLVDADPTILHTPSDVALEQMTSAEPNTPSSALGSEPAEGTEEKPFVI
jgi:DNA-binding response OmpR family regulator